MLKRSFVNTLFLKSIYAGTDVFLSQNPNFIPNLVSLFRNITITDPTTSRKEIANYIKKNYPDIKDPSTNKEFSQEQLERLGFVVLFNIVKEQVEKERNFERNKAENDENSKKIRYFPEINTN